MIENNDNLSLCNMNAICIYLANGFPATITGNDTGCDTIAEVEGTCTTDVCPSGDTTFLTQAEVDYFALQYPNCTQINGNVDIGDLSNDISDLQALENITSINGYLSIESTEITNFNGLHNLESVGGNYLHISRNDNITNMQGFDNLETVSGQLIVYLNDNLETLTGLESLTSLNNLGVNNNPSLLNLDGLNNIGDLISTEPDNAITINGNESLQNIDALSGVTYVNRTVEFQNNPVLQDISGLSNLTQIGAVDDGYAPNLRIQDNHTLTTLNLESLEAVYGKFNLFSNDSLENLDGLSSLTSVWGFTIEGNNALENIEGLSNLTNVVEPGFEVQDFEISHNPVLTSLTGLENVTKAGDIEIAYNDALTSYEGLSGLQEVGWGFILRENPLVTDLSGLESLTEIGVEPHSSPVPFLIWDHAALTNVEALSNLVSFNDGEMLIAGNPQLTSLSGLDNVDSTSIFYLELLESENLSYCEVASVCGFIANAPSGAVNIGNNATGCNTVVEVEDACALGTEEMALGTVSIYPNPASDLINIVVSNTVSIEEITFFDINGKRVQQLAGAHNTVSVSHLDNGIYFVSITTNKGTHYQRIIKK